MPFSRFAKMPGEKRERLMTVAAQEFAANGFEAASFNRILEDAQIGKSSAYYYFEDKADLFCTVVQYCIDRLQLAPPDEDVSSLTAETFWSELEKIRDRPLARALEQPWLFGVVRAAGHLTRESLQREPLAQLAHYLSGYITANMGAMIKRGQELELIRTDLPDDLLIAWFRAVDGASDDWLLAHLEDLDQEAITRISHQTIAIIRRMLAPLV